MKFIQILKDFILNILFPPHCVSCKKEGDFLCTDCIGQLKKRKIKNKPVGAEYIQPSTKEFKYLDGVIYGLDYAENPQIQAAIQQFKYRFTQELADYFGKLLAEKLNELNMVKNRQIVLIPVPLHKKRLNYRGFNQAEVITKEVGIKMNSVDIIIANVLKRTKHTSQQAKLNKKERHDNLADAFELDKNYIRSDSPDPLYFIVDDVFTTGSTLENCARTLKSNGFERVYGLVVARAFK